MWGRIEKEWMAKTTMMRSNWPVAANPLGSPLEPVGAASVVDDGLATAPDEELEAVPAG